MAQTDYISFCSFVPFFFSVGRRRKNCTTSLPLSSTQVLRSSNDTQKSIFRAVPNFFHLHTFLWEEEGGREGLGSQSSLAMRPKETKHYCGGREKEGGRGGGSFRDDGCLVLGLIPLRSFVRSASQYKLCLGKAKRGA